MTVRMLSNLKAIYLENEDYERALACCERILLITPDSHRDIYDRAVAYEHLGSPSAALQELTHLRNLIQDSRVRQALDAKIRAVEARDRPTLH